VASDVRRAAASKCDRRGWDHGREDRRYGIPESSHAGTAPAIAHAGTRDCRRGAPRGRVQAAGGLGAHRMGRPDACPEGLPHSRRRSRRHEHPAAAARSVLLVPGRVGTGTAGRAQDHRHRVQRVRRQRTDCGHVRQEIAGAAMPRATRQGPVGGSAPDLRDWPVIRAR